jgi:hypothetical protein
MASRKVASLFGAGRGGPGDARRQAVNGVVLEIFSRDQQVMGLLLPDAGPAQLLGFDDRTMMYEGDAKDWEAQVHWHGDQLRC